MTINTIGGIACFVIAAGVAVSLLLSVLRDVIRWAYDKGVARGRAEAEKAFVEYERGADEARQQIWRDEARQ